MVVGEGGEGAGGIMAVDLVVDAGEVDRDSRGVGVIIDLPPVQRTKRKETESSGVGRNGVAWVETHDYRQNWPPRA